MDVFVMDVMVMMADLGVRGGVGCKWIPLRWM